MTTNTGIDSVRQEAFIGKVLSHTSGTMTTLLAVIGDRLGLFKNLSERGPATAVDLAARTGLNERYLREWLGGMATAGYVDYDSANGRFTLPPEHMAALAQENGPFFFGGMYQMLPAFAGALDGVTEAFQRGGGVPQTSYRADFWDGLERFSAGLFDNYLLQEWIPAMPDVAGHLDRGCDVADVGSGRGRALIKLALASPPVALHRIRRVWTRHRARQRTRQQYGCRQSRPVRGARRLEGAAPAIRRHHDVRRGPRCD